MTLLRHCAHIRKLHICDDGLLRLLRRSDCTHLTELRYTVDKSLSGDPGFDPLMDVMINNLYLRGSFRVKNVILGLGGSSGVSSIMPDILSRCSQLESIAIHYSCPIISQWLSRTIETSCTNVRHVDLA
ncbi:hypothetical protein EDD11_007726 [Mortierella claussenii]|nr:hypothetical protein EDD11_007726 [Mortierella claussenii]